MLFSSSLVKVMVTQHVAQLWHLFSNCFAPFIFVAQSDGFLCIYINAICVSLKSCNISQTPKNESKHCRFATTSSFSLVLLDFIPRVFESGRVPTKGGIRASTEKLSGPLRKNGKISVSTGKLLNPDEYREKVEFVRVP